MWREAGDDFDPEIVFIAVAVSAALDDPDLVVQLLDQPKTDSVVWAAVRGDAVPMFLDHRHELLVGLQTLPVQALLPAPPTRQSSCRPHWVLQPLSHSLATEDDDSGLSLCR